jgi:hypothetical protein
VRLPFALGLAGALVFTACDNARQGVNDRVHVTCTEDGVIVDTPVARPRTDGIHVLIVNETDAVRSFTLSGDDTVGFGAAPGQTEAVADLGPGKLVARCHRLAEPKPGAPLTIVDPDGHWVPADLPCEQQLSSRKASPEGAKGATSDPLEAANEALDPQPSDVVEPFGYPDAGVPKFRLVRGGVPSMTVELIDDGEGNWLTGWVTECGSGLDER